jgi:ribosomal protein S6--L-glutamate ligase
MGPRICFLEQADKRSATSVVHPLLDRLREGGYQVEVFAAEQQAAPLETLVPDADLYLWKSHGRLCDSVAAYLHARGSPLLNEYFPTVQVRDKFVTTRRLIDAGLPTPDAVFGDSVEQLREVVRDYPVVVKSNGGRRGQQVALVRNVDELSGLTEMPGPVCAQRYLEANEYDLKAYVVGDQVFGVMRPSPLAAIAGGDRHLGEITPEARELCLRCGELFGLELYGVDLLQTPDGLAVIEVNCFPGYKGIAGVDRILADYIIDRVRSLS